MIEIKNMTWTLNKLIENIKPVDVNAMQSARARQDRLTKPQGSLGRLEELSIQVAGITAQPIPRLTHKVVTVMAGDHGVVAEGVSAYPQDVTPRWCSIFCTAARPLTPWRATSERAS
jgi:nicotinate-nucleotide--dimethylbenzimidazole phosphoribosyltransferase